MNISQVLTIIKNNDSLLSLLLNDERFVVENVIDISASLHNSRITIQSLSVVDDEDGLPEIVPSGIYRSYSYDREDLDKAVKRILPKLQSIPSITHDGDVNANSIVDSLLSYDLNLGYGAITVERIGVTNILILRCTNKSIRFRGETRIAIV